MKRTIRSAATFFLGAALSAAALPPPSATVRLSSADALFDAALAAGSLCVPDLAESAVGEIREVFARLGIVDSSRPVSAAVWADLRNGDDVPLAAAVISIPVLPEAKDRLAALSIPPEAFSDGVCKDLPVAGIARAALADRGDRFLVAVADARGVPAGLPAEPAALLAEGGASVPAEAPERGALAEIGIGRDAVRAMAAASCDDDSVDDMADALEDAFGLRAAAPLRKYLAASRAKAEAVVSVAADFWFDGASGLVAATVADLDPDSAAAAEVAARPALDGSMLPGDVPAGAVAWFAQSSPDPLSSSAKETCALVSSLLADVAPENPAKAAFAEALRKHADAAAESAGAPLPFSVWIAADGAGRPFFSARRAGTPAPGLGASARKVAEAAAGLLPGSGMAVSGVEGGWKLATPLDSVVEAAAREIASHSSGEPAEFDAAEIAELRRDAAFAARLFGATNEVSCAESDGALLVRWHAAGAEAPAGSVPDAKAAFSLAARAPAGMRPVAAWEFAPSLAVRKILDIYPETKNGSDGIAEALLPASGAAGPIVGLSLAGGGKVAEVTAVPPSELEFFSKILAAFFFGRMSSGFLDAGFGPCDESDEIIVCTGEPSADEEECDHGLDPECDSACGGEEDGD